MWLINLYLVLTHIGLFPFRYKLFIRITKPNLLSFVCQEKLKIRPRNSNVCTRIYLVFLTFYPLLTVLKREKWFSLKHPNSESPCVWSRSKRNNGRTSKSDYVINDNRVWMRNWAAFSVLVFGFTVSMKPINQSI